MTKLGFSKREIDRAWKKDQKAKLTKKLRQLRKAARREKVDRKARLKNAKGACDDRVAKAKERAQRAFQRARATAIKAQKAATVARNAARYATKKAARDKCDLDAAHIKTEAAAKLDATKAEATAERQYWTDFWATEKAQKGRVKKANGKRRARERKSESDDLVRQNLTTMRHLLPVFEKVKRRIKADKRRTRTEVFLDYVHDNPEDVLAAQAHATSDEELAKAERAYWEQQRGMVVEEDEVPF
ncbi:hypothetical protein LCGC14_1022810 [marine sediment metagenome]|uniref:Uncharacterized protein n=1 Tax=marine sediment metagenome TaxID=412755 RepID=A0A0F9NIJ3_9ZZZZ